MEPEIEKAYNIAVHDLRACYTYNGIVAGLTHFTQYWARDSFFASLGATVLEDFSTVKKQLQMFMKNQRTDGMIPSQITKGGSAHFRLMGGEIVDGTALFVIAFADYVKRGNDLEFADANFIKLTKAINWLQRKDKDEDGLIEEGIFCNWADSVFKFGKVLYSNCCYCKSLFEYAEVAEILKQDIVRELYYSFTEKTKKAINEKFWLPENGYYADWIDFSKHGNFASDGNALAMLWGIAPHERGKKIVKFVEKNNLSKVPMLTNFPAYNPLRIPPILWPFAARKYHNGFCWPWLGAMYAIALEKNAMHEKALKELEKISALINENKTVHEIFTQQGKTVNSLTLKSEHPFAWSSALFIRAVSEICR